MSENTVADQNDPATVAIVGEDPAARLLASALSDRGVDVAVGRQDAGSRSEFAFSVSFDADDAAAKSRFRDGSQFFAGAAARTGETDGEALAVGDARNLAWKLGLVLHGDAPLALLNSYEIERRAAAPDAPIDYTASPLTSQFGIDKKFRTGPPAGTEMHDHAVEPSGYDTPVSLTDLCGKGFAALFFTGDYDALPPVLATGLRNLQTAAVPVATIVVSASASAASDGFPLIVEPDRALHRQYGAMTGAFYLLRPDGVVAARWQHPSLDAISAALRRAIGHTDASAQPARSSGW